MIIFDLGVLTADYSSYPVSPKSNLPNALYLIFRDLCGHNEIEFWSANYEPNKQQRIHWLLRNLCCFHPECNPLKTPSIDDIRPPEQIFEQWIDEYNASMSEKLDEVIEKGGFFNFKEGLDMAFSSNQSIINLFRSRNIFVFDCRQ